MFKVFWKCSATENILKVFCYWKYSGLLQPTLIFRRAYKTLEDICDALCDLVPFVQFKKREKHPWRSVNFNKVAGFSLKLTLLYGCLSRFLSYTNGTKSRNAPYFFKTGMDFELKVSVYFIHLHRKLKTS